MFSVTFLIQWFNLERIYLSIKSNFVSSIFSSNSSFSIFIKINLDAFQILFKYASLALIFSSEYLVSNPGEVDVVKKYLKASTPYWLITSIGSIPFPKDLDILLPLPSKTKPWLRTLL